MEGVQGSATDVKGKGKAPEAEESMDDDSSDESGAEEQVRNLSTFNAQPANLNALGW